MLFSVFSTDIQCNLVKHEVWKKVLIKIMLSKEIEYHSAYLVLVIKTS